jgi:hypothetical protein
MLSANFPEQKSKTRPAVTMLALVLLFAKPLANPPQARIVDVRYGSAQDQAVVTIVLDHPAKFEYHKITNPDRIYLDFSHTLPSPQLPVNWFESKRTLLQHIRVGKPRSGVTRVTLVLSGDFDYTVVESDFSQVVVTLRALQTRAYADLSRCGHRASH